MNLSEPFIRRPVMTTLIMFATLVLGIMCYYLLPVSNLPDVNYPTINVTAAFSGSSPETMASTIATPLEKEFMTIPGVTTVTSTSTLGNTNIVLQFDVSKNIDAAAQDVEAAISRAKSHLSPNIPNDPVYRKVNPSDTPIVYIALTSDTIPVWDLYTYAYIYIAQRLSMLEGVAQVITYGSPYAVRVQVDPDKISALGITLQDVSDAIAKANVNLPTGQLDGPVRSSTILAKGQLENAAVYDPIIVSFLNGSPVRIQDIGKAIDSTTNDKLRLKYVDKDVSQATVVLAVQRQPGANTIKVADAVAAALPALTRDIPASVQLIKVFDRADSIRESVAEVKFTLTVAFVLVVFVIFIYLGRFIDTIIPSLAMPMSIVATFIVMYFLNYTIDNLSLLALTLAVGFIVDDAIVVLENIARHVEEGESPWRAALEGSRQISFTILSMTLSLIAVFIPMLFMGGLIGKIFQEFAVTLVVVTLASGIVSLTLTPMMCSRFIPPHDPEMKGFAGFSHRLNEWMVSKYKPKLQYVIDHPFPAVVVAILSVIISGYFFATLPHDFIPDDDIGFVMAYNQAEQGTSSERMYSYQDQFIAALQKNHNISTFVSISAYPDFRNGLAFIRLKPSDERSDSSLQVIQQLYPEVGKIPGIRTFFKNVPLIDLSAGPVSRGAYQFVLQSINTAHLYESGDKLEQMMIKSPLFQGVSSDLEVKTPQLFVTIDRDRASTLGITAEEIENALLLAYSGNRVSRIETQLDQYDVILEVDPKYQDKPTDLAKIYVRNKETQNVVPLDAVVKWKEGVGPASVNHLAQFPAVTISFNVAPGVPLGTALDEVQRMAKEVSTPDVTSNLLGAAQTFDESIRSAGYLLIFSVFAIYIVLGILYESFIHPITILSTLPPATLGGLFTLWLFGLPLSLYGYLGIILLIGIVKKNGIMMVDYALDNIRTKGESAERSIFDAAVVRFRPIMMTTVAAIFGALPIALGVGAGAQARRPLGLVIIGGLLLSQLITLFITPVIYLYLERLRERFSSTEQERREMNE